MEEVAEVVEALTTEVEADDLMAVALARGVDQRQPVPELEVARDAPKLARLLDRAQEAPGPRRSRTPPPDEPPQPIRLRKHVLGIRKTHSISREQCVEVVGVAVGDQHARHVGRLDAERRERLVDRRAHLELGDRAELRLVGRPPGGVDKDDPGLHLDRERVHAEHAAPLRVGHRIRSGPALARWEIRDEMNSRGVDHGDPRAADCRVDTVASIIACPFRESYSRKMNPPSTFRHWPVM